MISNFSVKLSCCSICMSCSCMNLWILCLYCNLFSAQLCNLLLSKEMLLVKFDLGRGLREVTVFLVVIRLCQMKCQLGCLLNLVHHD